MIKPHDYQQSCVDEIIEKFKDKKSVVLQSDTGSGKTVMFSFLAKYWAENKKSKVLILCNRSELIEQSAETLVKIGLTYEKVIPRTKRLHNSADVFLCMVETLYRRLLKNPRYLYNVGLIIADECHYMSFPKIYSFFNDVKILGVTATPILLGRDTFYRCARCESDYNELGTCCGMETYEWSKPKKLSDTYEDIVVGPTIDYLIEMGQLVKEINFVKTSADLSRLEIDSSGDFSNKSQDEAFGDDEAVFNCRLNYEQIAKGKRTVIFNNSTKTNVKVYEDFKNAGYPVRMYDSVNVTDETRQEIVNWFKETPGAILCNVATFLAGFDARNIECVILNVATLSIAKYLQAVGRGGRSCNEIYKPNFILIDGGNNVNRFGIWSDPTRDWKKMFFEGVGETKPKKEQPLSVKECRSCGMLYSRNTNICPECGESKPIIIKERVESEEILQPIDNIPLPNGAKISTYVRSKDGDIFMAFAIMTQQIVDLFMYHGIMRERYEKWKGNGKLDKRIGEIVRPCYFVFLSEFRGDGKRTLKQVLKKVGEKLDKYYNI